MSSPHAQTIQQTDLGVIVNNGATVSAPGFVTFYSLDMVISVEPPTV